MYLMEKFFKWEKLKAKNMLSRKFEKNEMRMEFGAFPPKCHNAAIGEEGCSMEK